MRPVAQGHGDPALLQTSAAATDPSGGFPGWLTDVGGFVAEKLATQAPQPAECTLKPTVGVDVTLDGQPPQVRVRGEIDVSNAAAFRGQLVALATKGSDVVVDLGGVEFLGVAGLDALCAAARLLGEHDHRLLVRSPPAVTRRVIHVLDLDGLLPIVSDEPLPPT